MERRLASQLTGALTVGVMEGVMEEATWGCGGRCPSGPYPLKPQATPEPLGLLEVLLIVEQLVGSGVR